MIHVPLLKVAPLVADRVQRFEGERPYMATGDLGGEAAVRVTPITYERRPSRADLTVQPGDVCFARMAATRKVFEFTQDNCDLILSTGFAVLRPREGELHPAYLRHWLSSGTFQAAKDRLSTGATQKAITNEKMALVTIPLPSHLDDQIRIAEILDMAEELRNKRRASLAQLDTLTRYIFLDMFGDPVSNPKRWPRKQIVDVAAVITGNTPSRAIPEYYGYAIEWIKSDNINTPHYYLTRAEEGLSERGREVARVAPKGSVLVTCIAGSPDSIGNAAMTDREVAFNQQINAIVPREGNAHFIYGHLCVGKRLVQQASTAAMKGMVSKSRFEQLALIWPPGPLQDTFSDRVMQVEQVKDTQRRSLDRIEALFTALEDRAFRGDL